MKDYIECITKHRAKHFVCSFCSEYFSDEPCKMSDCEWMMYIENEPSSDALKRNRGKWIKIGESCGMDILECSMCHTIHVQGGDSFCRDCGAAMDM